MTQSNVKLLSLLTLAGVVLGALAGYLIPEIMIGLGVIGQMFVNALRIILLPLIAAAIIMGISRLGGLTRVGRTAINTMIYFVVSTGIAVVIGLVLAMVFRPGAGLMSALDSTPSGLPAITTQTVSQFLLSLVPSNITSDVADGQILGLVVFVLFFGAVLSTLARRGHNVTEFFNTVHEVTMRLVNLLLWAAPVGLLFLVGSVVALNRGNIVGSADNLVFYILTLAIGLAIHAGVILPLILKMYGKESPLNYLSGASSALATAFGTASSTATLPMTYRATVDDNRVDQRAAAFVLPLGSTLNMNGTAMFVAIAALFVAQAAGLSVGIGQILLVGLVALLVSFGTAGIPGAGLIGLMSVLTLFDIDTATFGVAVIVSVDWLADRLRTVVNVWGDAVGTAVISQTQEFHRTGQEVDEDREDRGQRRDFRQSRGDRPSRGDRFSRDNRQSRGERHSRDERPSRGDQPSRSDRPTRSDRQSRDDRPPRPDREDRGDRGPSRGGRDDSRSRGPRREDSRPNGGRQQDRTPSPFAIAAESAPAIDATATPSTPAPSGPPRPSRSERSDRSDRGDSNDRRQSYQRRERPVRPQQRPEAEVQDKRDDKPKTEFRLDSPPPLPVIPARKPVEKPEPEVASQPERQTPHSESVTTISSPQTDTPRAEARTDSSRDSYDDDSFRDETPRDMTPDADSSRSERDSSFDDSRMVQPELFQQENGSPESESDERSSDDKEETSEPAFGRRVRRSRVAVTASGDDSEDKEAEPNRPQLDAAPSFSNEEPTYGRSKRKKPGR